MIRMEWERRQRKLTQAELGRQVGIDAAVISRLEGGVMHPYPGWRRRLAAALGVREGELMAEVVIVNASGD